MCTLENFHINCYQKHQYSDKIIPVDVFSYTGCIKKSLQLEKSVNAESVQCF